jgi:hypothetical protein
MGLIFSNGEGINKREPPYFNPGSEQSADCMIPTFFKDYAKLY